MTLKEGYKMDETESPKELLRLSLYVPIVSQLYICRINRDACPVGNIKSADAGISRCMQSWEGILLDKKAIWCYSKVVLFCEEYRSVWQIRKAILGCCLRRIYEGTRDSKE